MSCSRITYTPPLQVFYPPYRILFRDSARADFSRTRTPLQPSPLSPRLERLTECSRRGRVTRSGLLIGTLGVASVQCSRPLLHGGGDHMAKSQGKTGLGTSGYLAPPPLFF